MTPILTYHSIAADVPRGFGPWVVHPQRFREQLSHLAASHRMTMTVSEMVRRRRAGQPLEHAAVLTFDDGFADFLHNALPVLRDFHMASTLYVTTGLVGGVFHGSKVLTWGELAEIRDAGVEIGAHSVSHAALDRLSAERVREEVGACKRELEDRLGVGVNSFAYPFGYYTRAVRDAVVGAGYQSACAVGYAGSGHDDDRFALRRFIVRPNSRRIDRAPTGAVFYRMRAAHWAWLRQSLRRWTSHDG
jgi:peptidoglycan/xylan/chitin deacetylase (PgdA/CDA1 family)